MNSSQNSVSIDVHTFENWGKKNFLTLFCPNFAYPRPNFAFLVVFLAMTIFCKIVQNTMQNLYNIVELFILYLLIQLFRDLVQFELRYSLRRKKKFYWVTQSRIFWLVSENEKF